MTKMIQVSTNSCCGKKRGESHFFPLPFCQEVDEKPGQPLLQVGDCIQEAAVGAMMMENGGFGVETDGFLGEQTT